MLTKYGYTTIGVMAIISFLFIAVSFFISNNYVKYPLIAVGIFLFVFTLHFFRDPERTAPNNENAVVSPADGKVILIKDVFDDRYLNCEATQISIFMSPLNVHVNRIPISGTVEYVNYVKGEYLVASHDKADTRNERNEVGIISEKGKVLFTQVAGYVARRIVCELKTEDNVTVGEKFGMIKFGSRVDVLVPKGQKINVNVGDKVAAGETILFEFK